MQVHPGFGKQSGRIQVVGEFRRDLAHGVVIFLSGFLQIGIRIRRKPLGHRLDVGLLAGRSSRGQVHGFLHGIVRMLVTVGIGGIVVVRSHGLGDTPVGHRQLGIEFRGVLERARRLVMVEGINKAQSLIKELLRLRIVSGNRVMEIAQPRHQRDRVGLPMRGMILRRRAQTEQSTAQHLRQNFHLVNPPEFNFGIRAPNNRELAVENTPCKCAKLMPN